MRIDSHHHFWRYTPEEYGWIDESMAAIRRDFLPENLAQEIRAAGVDGVISVQARTTLEETRWLLDFARVNPWILGVVGWVPLCDPGIESILASFSQEKALKSVRHILQAEPDAFFAHPGFNHGVSLLKKWGWAYDLLVVERQLPAAIEFVDRHPEQTIVLDHIAKPRIRDAAIEPWKKHIVELARRPNVSCKISGMVTEADFHTWTPEKLKPYLDTVLEAFGPDRLLFGSDWPVCLVACGYTQWKNTVDAFVSGLSPSEKEKINGLNAKRIYKLDNP